MAMSSRVSDEKPGWGIADVVIGLAGVGAVGVGLWLSWRGVQSAGGWGGTLALMKWWLSQFALVVGTAIAYLASFAALLAIGSILSGTKLRPVRVFLSFQHAYEPLAVSIDDALARAGLTVLRLPFEPGRTHDEVIRESLLRVKRADAVVVIPGPEPSWMANELGLAVGLQKSIVVIKHLDEQRLSDSLYEGYPVFDWARLEQAGVEPLARFLTFAAKGRADVARTYVRALGAFGASAEAWFLTWFALLVIVNGILKAVGWFNLPASIKLSSAFWWFNLALFSVGFAFSFVKHVGAKIRGIRVARQKILLQRATYEEFEAVFSGLAGDRAILAALEREPLRPRYGPGAGAGGAAPKGGDVGPSAPASQPTPAITPGGDAGP